MRSPTHEESVYAEEQVRIVMRGLRRNASGLLDGIIDADGTADWSQVKGLQVYGNGTVCLITLGKCLISEPQIPGREAGEDLQFALSLHMARMIDWLVAKQGRNIMFFDPLANWAKGSPPPFIPGLEG